MKTLIFFLALAAAPWLRAQTSTLAIVEENGSRSSRLNLVFLSEGYTSAEMGKFATDVDDALSFLFTKEPWVRYRSYCNVYRIEVASNESGTDNTHTPRSTPAVLRDTYFHTGFVTNGQGFDRLNTISSTGSSRVYAVLNKHVPEYDIPIVIVNDSTYGGSGGPIAIATTNQFSAEILEHELGHSFAKLTDEYDEELPGYPATEYPNATTKTQRADIRWNVWIDSNTALPTPESNIAVFDPDSRVIGIYEGANYRMSGWYRPHDNALMRNLRQEPGSVTREAIVLTYYSRVSPMDDYAPRTLTRSVTSQLPLSFSVTPKVPSTGPALTVQWLLDNVPISNQTGTTLNIPSADIGNGAHKIKAVVRDPTDWVRRDPTGLISDEITWSLTLSNQIGTAVINTPLPPMSVVQEGQSLQLNATSTGPGPISYQWLRNNVPLNPAVTSPAITIGPLFVPNAGTYSVKVKNPAATVSHSCVVGVIKPNIPRVVVAKGRTATLPITASANVTSAYWAFNGGPTLTNNARYAGATTKSLQIKTVDTSDSGQYTFGSGDFTGGYTELLVVTDKPDYTGSTLTLPTTIIGQNYNSPFPLPSSLLRTPNKFSAVMPAGLRLDPKSGAISGVPTVASKDQVQGDEISFIVSNEFGPVTLKIRLLIKPLPPGLAGVFTGFITLGFASDSALSGPLAGRMDLTILSTGAYSGKALIGTETLPFKGTLSIQAINDTKANGYFLLKPKHAASTLYIIFEVNDAGDTDPSTASVSNSQFFAWRNRWLPPESLDPMKGYYTFAFEPLAGADTPKGHSFGSVTIDANGKTTATGRLADGESFTTTSHLSPEGAVHVYQPLYTTAEKGVVLALLDLNPTVGPTGPAFANNSEAYWQRPADPRLSARTYKAGFSLQQLQVFGGLYTPPDKNIIPMELPAPTGAPLRNALLTFDSTLGTDPVAVSADVSLNLKAGGSSTVNTPNPKLVSYSMTPADGRFKGAYTTKDNDPRPPLAPATSRPQVTRRVDYQGIIVRKAGLQKGYGFFLRDALPLANGTTTPTTSPRDSGSLELKNATP
jgi:IgA Peptidase M64